MPKKLGILGCLHWLWCLSKVISQGGEKIVLVKNSLLKNSFYNTAAGAVRIGLGILTIPLLIRLIGVEEYGLWTLASTVVGMVGLAEAGLSVATTVFVSQDLGKEDVDGLSQTLTVTFGAMFILATLAAIALWFTAASIVNLFPKLGQAQQLIAIQALQIGGLVVWARLLQQVLIGVEQAYQRYDLMNWLNTIQSILLSLGMLAVAWLGGRTVMLMQLQAVVNIVILLSHVWVVRSFFQGIHLRPVWNREKGLLVARYSAMMWLTSLGGALFTRADRVIVGILLDIKTLGVYSVITDITGQINTLSALPVQPLLPTVSNLFVRGNVEYSKLHQQVKQALQINGLVALGLGATIIILSPFIVSLIFPGKTSSQYILPFCISTGIYALYSINAVGYYVLLGIKAVNFCTANVLAVGTLSLIMISIGAYNFGLIGAIFGNSGYIGTLLLLFAGMKKLSIPEKLWIQWLIFPLLLFLVVFIGNLIIPYDQKSLRLGLALLQNFVLLIWFVIYRNKKLKIFYTNPK